MTRFVTGQIVGQTYVNVPEMVKEFLDVNDHILPRSHRGAPFRVSIPQSLFCCEKETTGRTSGFYAVFICFHTGWHAQHIEFGLP